MYLPIYLSVCLSVYLSIYLSASLKTKVFCKPSSFFWLQHQLWNLTTSKTQQFSETASIFALDTIKNEAILRDFLFFEIDNIKNEAILRDVLQKWKVECRADSLVPMRFAIFPVHLSKVLRLPRKSDARSYEVPHLSRKIISANLKIWCSKMQPLSGNHPPL